MHELRDIPGIGKASFELLEAAGFRDVRSLARADLDPLVYELQRANHILKAAKRPPARANVEKWILAAREAIAGDDDDAGDSGEPDTAMPVNFEAMPEVAAMLANAPCAIPFPGNWLAENSIAVEDVVPGILLNRYAGDLEIRIEDNPADAAPARAPSRSYIRSTEKPLQGRLEIDVSRVRRFGDPLSERMITDVEDGAPDRSEKQAPRVSTFKKPAIDPDAGKEKLSRRVARGVHHSNPWRVRLGALITIPLMLLVPVSIIVSPLLLLHDAKPDDYPWVRNWWLVFPILLPIFGLAWLIWGHACSCRICRIKLFVPSHHQKNIKAHHFPLLGYVLPLCLHLLCFGWFRCTHCGTPVRLSK